METSWAGRGDGRWETHGEMTNISKYHTHTTKKIHRDNHHPNGTLRFICQEKSCYMPFNPDTPLLERILNEPYFRSGIQCELLFNFQDVEMDSQSQSSFERTLSERGQSQMSTASDEAWRGKPHARKQPTLLLSPAPFSVNFLFFLMS